MLLFGKKSQTIVAMVLSAALTTAAHAAGTESRTSKFHPPQTAQERWLDAVLHKADALEPDLTPYMVGNPEAPQSVKSFVTQNFTPELIKNLTQKEKEEIQKNCNGQNRADEICGTDYLPWACVQDMSEKIEYKTIKGSDINTHTTVIEMRLENEPRPKATYTITGKKIGGIQCHF
ncbi:MAG: hypothetical protein ABTQ34_05440 [Bdellovibrionales bacterium]